jgi:maltose-binding protein MalE
MQIKKTIILLVACLIWVSACSDPQNQNSRTSNTNSPVTTIDENQNRKQALKHRAARIHSREALIEKKERLSSSITDGIQMIDEELDRH